MARTDNLTNFLVDVATAIKNKKGTAGTIKASNFDTEISTITMSGDTGLFDDLIEGSITEITTGATKTRSNCFYQCTSLTKCDFSSLTSIGSYSFRNCSKLATVIIRTLSVCSLGNKNAFTGTLIESGLGYIYVPDDLVEAYKLATNWSVYADNIKSLSELEV